MEEEKLIMTDDYIQRLPENPIIEPEMEGLKGENGENINGPSIIKVPEWVENPLGKYYLYFAHHGGNYIRLAYTDNLEDTWKIYAPGTLQLDQTVCESHVASPDVHVDNKNQQIIMYFHGPSQTDGIYSDHGQLTYYATSKDGVNFEANSEVIAPFYFRGFKYNNYYYGIAKNKNTGGLLLRSPDPFTTFEYGKEFIDNMRHAAVLKKDNELYVFYSRMRDKPERILMSKVNLNQDWLQWEPLSPVEILKPQKDYEGANLPVKKSRPGSINNPVHQLRDPAVFEENNNIYIFYSVVGENGIAAAVLEKNDLKKLT